jgi:hypothetical protein
VRLRITLKICQRTNILRGNHDMQFTVLNMF